MISKSVGKFKLVSTNIKRKFAIRKLEKLGVLARLWINNRKNKYRTLLIDLLE